MAVLFKNNASSRLAVAIAAGAVSLSVTAGEGAKFPSPGAGDWFPLTLIKTSGALEIVRCTARSGDVLTITRAQEDTSAQAFSVGDRVELRLTSGAIDAIRAEIAAAQAVADASVKKVGDTMTGLLKAPSITVGSGAGTTGILDFRAVSGNASTDARIYVASPDGAVSGGQLVIQAAKGISINGRVGAVGPIISDDTVAAKSGRAVLGDGTLTLTAAAAGQNLVAAFVNHDFTMRSQLYADPSGYLRYSIAAVEKFRVQLDGIVAAGKVYANGGAAFLDTDGNVSGTIWGGLLSNFLSANYVRFSNLPQAIADIGATGIGSYGSFYNNTGANRFVGDVVNGSGLLWASNNQNSGTSPTGTWRCSGNGNAGGVTTWQRVS